jgi:hypothetical protein
MVITSGESLLIEQQSSLLPAELLQTVTTKTLPGRWQNRGSLFVGDLWNERI